MSRSSPCAIPTASSNASIGRGGSRSGSTPPPGRRQSPALPGRRSRTAAGPPISAAARAWTRQSISGRNLSPGAAIEGPAIIEEPTTTIVVDPGTRTRLSEAGNFILEAC